LFRLFEENSELLELFEKFANLRTKQEQEESLELAEHATMVMSTLDNAIRTLDNPDSFVQFVEQVGASHRRIPGFNKEFFWVSL
jgi:hemoglobin-like flavoprotein